MKLKLLLTYIILVFFVGCKTKRSISENTVITKKDNTVNNIVDATKNELIISMLCDSITGKPKDFETTIENGNTKTTLKSKDNKLTLESKSDSIVYVDRNVAKEVFVEKDKEVVRNVIPFKYWAALTVSILYGLGMTYLWIRK